MKPLPEVLMQWKEPLAFSQVRHPFEPKRNYWPFIFFNFFLSIVLVALWFYKVFALNIPGSNWILFAAAMTPLPMLGIQYLVNYRVPTNIIVWNRWISRYSWGTPQTPAYDQLKDYVIINTPDYRILKLTKLNDEKVLIGVPLDLDIAQLEGILTERGVMKRMA